MSTTDSPPAPDPAPVTKQDKIYPITAIIARIHRCGDEVIAMRKLGVEPYLARFEGERPKRNVAIAELRKFIQKINNDGTFEPEDLHTIGEMIAAELGEEPVYW